MWNIWLTGMDGQNPMAESGCCSNARLVASITLFLVKCNLADENRTYSVPAL